MPHPIEARSAPLPRPVAALGFRPRKRILEKMPTPRSKLSRSHLWGFLWTLIRTDFKTRYHGNMGGFVWALLKPAAMFIVLMAIFSLIFANDANYKLNLVIGLFLWDFFAESTKVGLTSLHAKGFLLTKSRFPAWLIVFASTFNALVTLAVFGALIISFLAFTAKLSFVAVLAFLGYQACFLLIILGVSLGASVLFLRYRDLNQVWEVVLQAGFFVAPIIYPLGLLPETVHALIYLWPPTPIIEFSRDALILGQLPTAKAHLLLVLSTFAILGTGALIHYRLGPRAAEYL